ncbi:MAG: hypothetical protein Nk1A_7980 [Endomicrobiia bacterium]|nr:MAG: hypothetical protein Nk1A_7980 [Endomicrobiia bacterium]
MSQICAIPDVDIISKLKAAGGRETLAASLGVKSSPNYDKLNDFLRSVIKSAPSSAVKEDVIV